MTFYGCSFSRFGPFFFFTCMHHKVPNQNAWGDHYADPRVCLSLFLLWSSLLLNILPLKYCPTCPLRTPKFEFIIQSLFPLLCALPGNSLQAVGWVNCRSHLNFSLLSEIALLPVVQYLKNNCFKYFVRFCSYLK